jgi:NADH-quinone oxidoreductase subunit J
MFDKVSLFVLPAVLLLAGVVGFAFVRAPLAFDATALRGSVSLTSETLFNMAQGGPGYFLLFEVLGLLLLSAMVAAVLLAKKRLGTVESENTEESH